MIPSISTKRQPLPLTSNHWTPKKKKKMTYGVLAWDRHKSMVGGIKVLNGIATLPLLIIFKWFIGYWCSSSLDCDNKTREGQSCTRYNKTQWGRDSRVLDTTLCDQVCQWLEVGQWFSPGTSVASTNKTDCHDITEILLKVASNTIPLIMGRYLETLTPEVSIDWDMNPSVRLVVRRKHVWS